MNGQLTDSERKFLRQAVLIAKPQLVLEVGTWKGGGSTWQIASALFENNHGMLYTCETEKAFYDEAMSLFKYHSHVRLHLQPSCSLIQRMISNDEIPDFIFMDGPEDETTAMNDLNSLMPYLRCSALLCVHDFDPPSIKAAQLRPYLENSNEWELMSSLSAPESVGICLWRKTV